MKPETRAALNQILIDYPGTKRCEKCNEVLNEGRLVWLELDRRTNTYTDDEDVPHEHSQGWFTFGKACAARLRKEHAKVKNQK